MKNKFKDPKVLIIAILIIVLVAVMIITLNSREGKSFQIEDKCGKFVNLFSHTIEDEATCKSRCKTQCESIDYKLRKIEFIKKEKSCNLCTCYCK